VHTNADASVVFFLMSSQIFGKDSPLLKVIFEFIVFKVIVGLGIKAILVKNLFE